MSFKNNYASTSLSANISKLPEQLGQTQATGVGWMTDIGMTATAQHA